MISSGDGFSTGHSRGCRSYESSWIEFKFLKSIRIEQINDQHGSQRDGGFCNESIGAKYRRREGRCSPVIFHIFINYIRYQKIEGGKGGISNTKVSGNEGENEKTEVGRRKDCSGNGEAV